nr:hypothetical protein [Bacteroidota bacterium]
MRNFVIIALAALTLACTPEPSIDVLCTTSVVADAARQLLPEEISVQALMQSNIDP